MQAQLSPNDPRYPYGAAVRYGGAAALGALGLVFAAVLPILGSAKVPFIACYTVLILVSAALGGFWPGVLCTLLCTAGVVYWLEPHGKFDIHDPSETLGAAVLVLNGVIVSAISERMHRAMRFERKARVLAEQTSRAEQAAREATQQALEIGVSAQKARDEMLGLVAHDLRDPLGVIDMNVGLIEKLAGASEQVRQRAAVVHRTVRRMSRLIGALLDSSQVIAGELSIDLDVHSMEELLVETVEEHQLEAKMKAIQLDHDSPRGLPMVLCDRDRVLQVLSNLVTNAVRFTPSGGRIQLRASSFDGFVRVSVSDTGAGISAAMLPHVFERYSRDRREKGGRTGLGLSIAKFVVERHGGTIQVASKEGAGSTFSFTLPVAGAPPSEDRLQLVADEANPLRSSTRSG
jgi:signal transduction histidine kinase